MTNGDPVGTTVPIFLSYHSEDREIATSIYRHLTENDLSVWFDIESIPAGADWVGHLGQAHAAADTFLVLLTGTAPRRWVNAEIGAALRRFYGREEDAKAVRIIPVLVGNEDLSRGNAAALDVFLGAFQHIHLSATDDGIPESELARLVSALKSEPSPASVEEGAATPTVVEPFRGLESFNDQWSHLFFGRDDEIARLVAIMESDEEWLQVQGASGNGKSSLVRAGLVPELARRRSGAGEPEWQIVEMRPGNDPVKALAQALLQLDKEVLGASNIAQGTLDEREQRLWSNDQALTNELRQWNAVHQADRPRRIVLVVDQFEELFLSTSPIENPIDEMEQQRDTASQRQQRAAESAQHFINLLLAAVNDDSGPLRLVSTIRSDFVHHIDRHEGMATALNNASRFTVPPLTGDHLRMAIEQPLGMAGGKLGSPELLNELLMDTEAGPGRLPLLSHALFQLWHRAREANPTHPVLTLADYHSIGGVGGAVAKSADEILAALRAEGLEDATRSIFLSLVHVGRGTRDIKRTCERSAQGRGTAC